MIGPVLVSVTERHIAQGSRCSGDFCPVALAWLEASPDTSAVCVERDRILFAVGDRRYRADLPREARRFVSCFDIGGRGAVRDITFEVTPELAS